MISESVGGTFGILLRAPDGAVVRRYTVDLKEAKALRDVGFVDYDGGRFRYAGTEDGEAVFGLEGATQ